MKVYCLILLLASVAAVELTADEFQTKLRGLKKRKKKKGKDPWLELDDIRNSGKVCHGREEQIIPIASVLHYSDDACTTLDTNPDFKGYYTNTDATPGTPEANYRYFCDPVKLKNGEYSQFGITRLSSCYYDNGGNIYAQPVGLCASFFVPSGDTLSVKITSINRSTGEISDEVYFGSECQGDPIATDEDLQNNECLNSTVSGSYQFVIPDAVNIACIN